MNLDYRASNNARLQKKLSFTLSTSAVLIFIAACFFVLLLYRIEISISGLDYFLQGDEDYYQSIGYEGKSSLFAKFAQIPIGSEFKEIARLITIIAGSLMIFTFIGPIRFSAMSSLIFGLGSAAFLYTLIRDPWIIITVLSTILAISKKNIKMLYRMAIAMASALVLINIAPDIFGVLIFALLVSTLLASDNLKLKVLALIVGFIFWWIFGDDVVYLFSLNVFDGARNEGYSTDLGPISLLTAAIKFYLGPGIFRIIYSEEYFLEKYPVSYLFSYFMFTLCWYYFLVSTFSQISLRRFILCYRENSDFALSITFGIMFSLIYILADGGSTGYRKRYIAFTLIALSILKYRKKLAGDISLLKGFIVFFLVLSVNVGSL